MSAEQKRLEEAPKQINPALQSSRRRWMQIQQASCARLLQACFRPNSFHYYDVDRWLEEHGADPFRPVRNAPRNDGWHHMFNADIMSMPDK